MMTSMLPRVALLYLHFSVSMPPLLRITTAAAHNSRADFMRGVDDLLGVGLLAARDMRFAMGCAHKQRLQQRTLLNPAYSRQAQLHGQKERHEAGAGEEVGR